MDDPCTPFAGLRGRDMKNHQVVDQVRRELQEGLGKVGSAQSPFVRRVARRTFRDIADLEVAQIVSLSEQLLQHEDTWEFMVSFAWISEIRDRLVESDFDTFERWLSEYIFSWGTCDDFCKRVLNHFVDRYPGVFARIQAWTSSENKWVRRASAVSLITSDGPYYVVKHDLDEAFDIALRLLTDEDHHVQKGYGWMLKAASVYHPQKVFEFVIEHKDRMPRTSLRYAIEKLSKEQKQKAMSR
jgi:3-methyladenine DNA glycosylase AlkD